MSIRIKPSHRGLLTKKVGKKGLKTKALKSRLKKTKSGKLKKEITFALNARKWNRSHS